MLGRGVEAVGGSRQEYAGSAWEIFVLSTQPLLVFDPHSPGPPTVQDHHLTVLKDVSGSFYMILITISHDAEPCLSLMLCVDRAILFIAVF